MINRNNVRSYVFSVIILLAFAVPAAAQDEPVPVNDLKAYTGFLASDSLKGRKPGTAEINVAARYILGQFRTAGLRPLADDGFQWFGIVRDIRLGEGNRMESGGTVFELNRDYIPLSFSASATLEAPVVFAGYGFDIDTDSLRWSDYRGVDVNGKWVMVARADPELDNPDSRFIPYSDVRSKVLTAKDKGAAGLLLITPRAMEKEDKLMPLTIENNDVTAGIPVIHITRAMADQLLRSKAEPVDTLLANIVNRKQPASFQPDVTLKAATDLLLQREQTANVVALLEGSDPGRKDEYIVIGAHYDHLGFGGEGSGSRLPDTVAIHNGADDNASGTALIMALADHFGKPGNKPAGNLLFVAFSAEEMGLIGSKYFVANPVLPGKKITAMFNFDMVGRFDPEKNAISVSGTGTSAEADSLLKSLEKELPFAVVHSPDGYGPSDHAAFYSSNIPVFYFNTGVHTDYHTPFDDADRLDYETMRKVGLFAASVIRSVDRLPAPLTFRESGKKDQAGRSGRKLKVTLGIMPDFAGTEKRGLRIDGVTKDGPADKGGMKKGDIITAMNGMKVANIYEYMSRLQKLKSGMTVNVEVIREEKTAVLIIQL